MTEMFVKSWSTSVFASSFPFPSLVAVVALVHLQTSPSHSFPRKATNACLLRERLKRILHVLSLYVELMEGRTRMCFIFTLGLSHHQAARAKPNTAYPFGEDEATSFEVQESLSAVLSTCHFHWAPCLHKQGGSFLKL